MSRAEYDIVSIACCESKAISFLRRGLAFAPGGRSWPPLKEPVASGEEGSGARRDQSNQAGHALVPQPLAAAGVTVCSQHRPPTSGAADTWELSGF